MDTQKFIDVSKNRIDKLKQKYNISNQIIVSLPGRLSVWKGQDIFLEAIKTNLVNRSNIKYLIIGNGSDKIKNQLQEFIKKNDLPVIIDSECDDIPAMYHLSDIIISASTVEETFGRVVVEGQASGKIVIASAIGGSLETIIDKKTGFLVPPNDAKALANKIIYVIDNNISFKNKVVKNSKNFDLKVFEKNIINFYNLICNL